MQTEQLNLRVHEEIKRRVEAVGEAMANDPEYYHLLNKRGMSSVAARVLLMAGLAKFEKRYGLK